MSDQPKHPSPVLQEILDSLSQSADQVSALIDLLNSILDDAQSDPDNEDAKAIASLTLTQLHSFISSPSLDQGVIDQLSFDLPKAVSMFGGVSDQCLEVAESIIDRFVIMCGARDMLAILGDALDYLSEKSEGFGYVAPLLNGFSKVILCLERRHFEQVKAATRIILKVLKAVCLELEEAELKKLFDRAVGIANSIQAVCGKLDGGLHEKLCALLGLYVLEIMALVSMNSKLTSQPFALKLSSFLPFCALSYLGLITGSDIDKLSKIVIKDDEDNYISCLSDIKCGAALSVIWGHISDEIEKSAEANLATVQDELENNQTKRWQAFGMLKHILGSLSLPWELKKHAFEFLLTIRGGNVSPCDEHDDLSYMPSLFAVLQAIQMVIMYAPNSVLRKNAFDEFKWIVADIPTSHRIDILQALITNSESPSMIAILLDIVKAEMHKENCEIVGRDEVAQAENKAHPHASLWTADVLELVQMILRPPNGGPPIFPEQSDAVLSALNLYRFILIAESRGKTNYTGVLSRSHLQKAYNEWLLPLRTVVTAMMANNKNGHEGDEVEVLCTFNPVELVLYRCIELVEEKLKESK